MRTTELAKQILSEDTGYRMRHERSVSHEESQIHKYIDKLTLEQLTMIEKKVEQRKERLTHIREQSERKGV